MVKEQYVETKQETLAYRDSEGAYPVLVLLHGSSASSLIFSKLFDFVQSKKLSVRLIAFDSPGHGLSSEVRNPELDYTHIGCARMFLEALQILNIERFAVYGWSKGGHEAINMLSLAEKQISSLIVDGTPPLPTEAETIFSTAFLPIPEIALLGKDQFLTQEEDEKFVGCQGFDIKTVPFMIENAMMTIGKARAWPFQYIMQKGERVLEVDVLKNTNVSALILCGKDDMGVNYKYVSTLMGTFPQNIQFKIVDGPHGHLWTHSDQFNENLIEFIQKNK